MTFFATDMLASTIGVLPYEVVANTLRRLVSEIDPDDVTLAKLVEAVKTRPVLPPRTMLPPAYDSSGPAERRIYFPPDNGKEPYPVAHPDEAERERMRQWYAETAAFPGHLAARRDLGITQQHLENARAKRADEARRHEDHVAALQAKAELDPEEREIVARAQARLEHLRGIEKPRELTPLRGLLKATLARLGKNMALTCTRCSRLFEDAGMRAYVDACMDAGAKGAGEPTRLCIACLPKFEADLDNVEIPF